MRAMLFDVSAIPANFAAICERIARAAARSGRTTEEITLVAVTKTFPAEAIRAAYAAGVRHFGENRVQEWEEKSPHLADLDTTWHLIGHLQSNKARRAASLFHAVDSLDSIPLAQRLSFALAESADVPLPFKSLRVLVEVHLSPEPSKSGVSTDALPALAETIIALPHLDLRGLMTIPPLTDDPTAARPYFARLRELRDTLARRIARPLPVLSMGMSHDFEIAIEEGATEIRIGSALFGARE